jgi:hypothetical protein
MATVFTPGLCVTEHQIVQKTRQLPLSGEVQVKVGDLVKADDVVARTELPGKVYPVNIANQLGIDAARLEQHMEKKVGERVKKDEIVARTPGIFGLFSSESAAIVDGTIESISTVTGLVIFQADPVPVEIDAYINGRVVEVIPTEGCVVQAAATFVQGIFGLGGEQKGELVVAVDSPDGELEPSAIRDEYAGKVVVGGCHLSLEALQRAVEVGVCALVTGGFDYDEIKQLLGHELGVAVTGGEDLGLSLVVTEGFGRISMAPATFEILQGKQGKRASVNGATQIRAGVMRPEVVITFDDEDVPSERVAAQEPSGIAVGDTVRGIRTPWFGRIGTVVELPVQPVKVDSETTVRILEVEFAGGERARLPRANVERIER